MNPLCTDANPKLALEPPCGRGMHHFRHGVDLDSASVRSILGMGERGVAADDGFQFRLLGHGMRLVLLEWEEDGLPLAVGMDGASLEMDRCLEDLKVVHLQ